jgi:hypothetical protein
MKMSLLNIFTGARKIVAGSFSFYGNDKLLLNYREYFKFLMDDFFLILSVDIIDFCTACDVLSDAAVTYSHNALYYESCA